MKMSAITRITFGVVSLFVCLVLLFDLLFKLFPSEQDVLREVRRKSGEHLAIQAALLTQSDDLLMLERTLRAVKARDSSLVSIGMRRVDGSLIAQAGEHQDHWGQVRADRDLAAHEVLVPLITEGRRWGALEIAYQGGVFNDLAIWVTSKPVQLIFLIAGLGSALVYFYMRRVLVHLDPSSAVPDRVRSAFDALTEAIMVIDIEGRIVMANQSLSLLRNPGARKGERDALLGKRPSEFAWLAAQLDSDPRNHPWNKCVETRQPVLGTPMECEQSSGRVLKLVVNCAPVTDSKGAIRGCIVTIDDVTDIATLNQQLMETLTELAASKDQLESQNGELQRLASRDPLTGCLNRRSFMIAFDRMFEDASQRGLKLACMMVDIDKFKNINDTMGHAVGDKAIQSLAKVLNTCVRQTDLVCRYGGEEFCIVIPAVDEARAKQMGEQIRATVEKVCGPETAGRADYRVTASLGVSMLEHKARTAAALLDQADQALYIAKQTGRNKVVAFQLQEDNVEREYA